MHKIPENSNKPKPGIFKKTLLATPLHDLHQHAFDNSLLPNIITITRSGEIISVNNAACKLLGWSKKELLTKSRIDIFDTTESSFKKMLGQRKTTGQSIALVTAIKKNGNRVPCEITSARFMEEDGIEKAIYTITDRRENILLQKNIDIKKEKTVADNIVLAKSKQKVIDIKKEKIVAHNIVLVKSKQKTIDIKKEKIVAHNIVTAQAKADSLLEKNNEWIKYIAETSYDVMWDWDVATNEIYVGNSIREVFGYTVKNNLVQYADFLVRLLPKERAKVKKKISKTIASSSKTWSDAYMIKRDDGSIASTTSRAYIVRDDAGVAMRLIGATQDVSRLLELEKKLQDQITLNRTDAKKGKLVAGNIVLARSKQKSIDIEKEKVVAGNIIIAKSKQKNIDIKKEKIVAANIIEAQTKSDQRLAANIAEHHEIFQMAAKQSVDVIWDWNMLTNEVFIGGGFEELFGYPIKNNKGNISDLTDHIYPDDKALVKKLLNKAISSNASHWEHAHRFIRHDGSVAKVFKRASIIRDTQGKAYRMIGAMQDLSRQKDLEEKLEQEINLKEKQIAEATEDAKDMERSDIGKELHDNINQILGASRMYLEMSKRGGENSAMYLSRSSHYTLTAIEEIRKLTKGFSTDVIKNIGLYAAIENIANDTMEVNPVHISYSLKSFAEHSVTDKFKLNVYRIVQEQLNNILKHAQATEVSINLLQNKKSITLTISDNGIGFDIDKKRKGVGVINIKSRALAYAGIAEFVSQPGHGCTLTATFPVAMAV